MRKAATRKKPPPPQFAPVFYDPAINPVEYKKNDPLETYKWTKEQVEKIVTRANLDDEFITEKEKEDRLAIIKNTLAKTPPITFVVDCEKKYDADNKEYIFSIRTSKYEHYERTEIEEVKIKSDLKRIGALNIKSEERKDVYTGENAFGAKSTIQRTTKSSYVIAFPLTEEYPPDFTIRLPLDIENAKSLKDKLACLYSISIDEPYLIHFLMRTQATRDNPYEDNSDIRAFFGKIEKIAILDKNTGKIFKEYSRK